MKRFIFMLLGALYVLPAWAQHASDSLWVKKHYYKQERRIPMRDGVHLFTAIYLPKDNSEKHPILITRTPYSAAPYGEQHLTPNLWNIYWNSYAHENYIIVVQDVRGRWMSEGEFKDVRPFNPNKLVMYIDEASDTYDTIDWLLKNIPGNNGQVGAFGISYPGFYTTMAGLSRHPALKAVSPQAPVTDWFRGDDFHHNGAFFLMDCFGFYTKGFGYPHPKPISVAPVQALRLPCTDNYQTFLKIGTIQNFTKLTGDSLAFWKEIIAHPHYDDWWKARDPRNYVDSLQPAVLVVGGLFDAEDCYGAWNLYKAIELRNPASHFNRLVMGPWYHGQWASTDGTHLGNIQFGGNTANWYQQHIEVPFFNYYLKGKGELSAIAEANVFFSGENKWHQYDKWPPVAQEKEIFLQGNGQLAWHKSNAGFSEYVSDPAHPVPYTQDVHYIRTRDYMTDDQRFASRRADVLTFETDTLTEDLTIGGTITADLRVNITGSDADFVIKVIDVFPDDFRYPNTPPPNKTRDAGGPYPLGGYQMLVRGDIFRGRFRHSFEQPQAFEPGAIEQVKFQLPDVAHTFQKGHRLMIQVQSTWFPLADRNPQQFVNIYEAVEKDFVKETIRIYHDDKNSSGIILPVLK
jgi:putative CocE/NonD family hydrolase